MNLNCNLGFSFGLSSQSSTLSVKYPGKGVFSLKDYYRLFFILIFGFVFCQFFFLQVNGDEKSNVNISDSTGKSDLAQISVLDNNIYVIWRDNSTGNEDIYFAKSIDSGASFSKHVNLSNNSGTSAFPRIAIANENVYVTWYDYTPGQSDIFFAKSYNNGDSFESINLSNNGGVSFNPWIAAYENNVYVVWNDETPQLKNLKITKPENVDIALGTLDILLATSHDGGSTFVVSNLSETKENSLNPRITIQENNVYIVWTEITNESDEIFFAASSDNGNTFSSPLNVSKTVDASRDAGIEVVGNHIYIIWQESTSGGGEIFFSKSENNGLTFSEPIIISNGGLAGLARDTQMVALDEMVYVVWYDITPDGGIFFVKSNDYGNSFSKPINLSGGFPGYGKTQVAAYGDNLYIIWQDDRLGNSEIFLRSSGDKGQSFGSIVNLSNDSQESNIFILGPQIAVNDQNSYVIFEKITNSKSDLFISSLNHKVTQKDVPLILQTMDSQIKIEAIFDKQMLDIDEPVAVNLMFFNASSDKLLEEVEYSLTIEDVFGNTTLTRTNLFAENGVDNQTLNFDSVGSNTISVSISEIGGMPIQESDYSISTDAIVTVVPEFPVGISLVLLFVFFVISLLMTKSYKTIYHKLSTH